MAAAAATERVAEQPGASSDANQRLLLTAVAIAVIVFAQRFPLPGVPREIGGSPLTRGRWLTLGLAPYLAAASITLYASGAFGRLRRLREGDRSGRRRFDRAIIGLAVVVGLIQAVAYSLFLTNLAKLGGTAPPSAALLTIAQVAGFLALLGIAGWITSRGLGSGVALVVLATTGLGPILDALPREIARVAHSDVGFYRLPIVVAAFGGLIALCVHYLTASHEVMLAPIEPAEVSTPNRDWVPLRVRLDLVGVGPAVFALWLLALPRAMAALVPGFPSEPFQRPVVYWPAFTLLTLLGGFVMTAIAFDTRRVAPVLARFGYRVVGLPAGQDAETFLDRLIQQRILVSSALLIALVALPAALAGPLAFSLDAAGLGGLVLLVGTAIVLDTWRSYRQWRALESLDAPDPDAAKTGADPSHDAPAGNPAAASPAAAPSVEDADRTWVPVFSSDTELEARLALAMLAQRGMPGRLISNRAIPMMGTLALWEWTVPTYPSLVIHRRLGGGAVIVHVLDPDVERACDLLEAA